MGMFDSFICKTKCPYCNIEQEFEFQTKQFNCMLNTWKTGDVFDVDDIDIETGSIKDVYARCHDNKKCHNKDNKWYFDGARMFFANIRIKDGIIQGAYDIRKEEEVR